MSVPNYPKKIGQKAVFEPSDYLDHVKKMGRFPTGAMPKKVILCYHTVLLNHVISTHEISQCDGFLKKLYILKETDNEVGIIGGFGIGAPAASTYLEELIGLGISKFISIGTAGSISKNIFPGDFVICNKALRDDGVSYHYVEQGQYVSPSREMLAKIINASDSLGIKYKMGPTWTTDAPYRSTPEEVKHYSNQGILTVEMEAAALFAVAQYRGVSIGSMFTISDSLADLKWNPHFFSDIEKNGLEKLFKIALNSLMENN